MNTSVRHSVFVCVVLWLCRIQCLPVFFCGLSSCVLLWMGGKQMPVSRREFLGIAASAAAGARLSAQNIHTLEPGSNGMILKDPAGRVVLAYLTSKPEGLA